MPPLNPLREWICDTCGSLIALDKGWIEWLETDGMSHSFRICHNRRGCYIYDRHAERGGDLHLADVVGHRGLIFLLSWIDAGPHLVPTYPGPTVRDLREWKEIVHRLHTPHYEEGRLYLEEAERDGLLNGANELTPYSESYLQGAIRSYGRF